MKQTLRTPFGKTRIYSQEGNASPGSPSFFVAPGFSETLTHNRKLVDALSSRGYTAETFSPPRRSSRATRQANNPIERQGDVVLGVLEATHPRGEKVHALAHSLGSPGVLRAARKAPGRFASITLMQPLGMVDEKTLRELAELAANKNAANLRRAVRGQSPGYPSSEEYAARVDSESGFSYTRRVLAAQVAGVYVVAKGLALAWREAKACGTYALAEDVASVTALGIPVHLFTAYDDEMFGYGVVQNTHAEIGEHATPHSTIADREAGHDAFWLQPKRTAEIASQLIPQT